MKPGISGALVLCVALVSPLCSAGESLASTNRRETMSVKQDHSLTAQQKYMALIAARAAAGDLSGLNATLQQGLDAGLTISDCREILVQLYAYAGFPRSLNALGELMKVMDERRSQGTQDATGRQPGPQPKPEKMLAAGTQNQTDLVGVPVTGPLFDFAPAIDTYLKTHLFGDIFSRDNLDWKSRELATVGALSAMAGVESQLKAHLNISINIGLSASQLAELVPFFTEKNAQNSAQRLRTALESLQSP